MYLDKEPTCWFGLLEFLTMVGNNSGDKVSIAGQMGELSGTVTAVVVIGPDSTAEDTGAATVEVDAAVV